MCPLDCPQGFSFISPADLVLDQRWRLYKKGLKVTNKNILTKFHADCMKNVASRVFSFSIFKPKRYWPKKEGQIQFRNLAGSGFKSESSFSHLKEQNNQFYEYQLQWFKTQKPNQYPMNYSVKKKYGVSYYSVISITVLCLQTNDELAISLVLFH